MSDGTKIEWAEATWNPLRARNRETGKVGWFCVHASDGCKLCYAETMNARLGTGVDYKAQNADKVEVFIDDKMLLQPLRWRKPRAIFVCSMTDLFGEFVPDAMIDGAFAVMALCPHHTWIVLTKRSARMRKYFSASDLNARIAYASVDANLPDELVRQPSLPLRNVWLGVSVEDQPNAEKRIPDLLRTPAAVRFISAEPLLGPIDLTHIDGAALDPDARGITLNALTGGSKSATPWHLNWVIVGGESGRDARPFDISWAGDIVTDCAFDGVACFVKQIGARPIMNGAPYPCRDAKGGDPDEWPESIRVREWPQQRRG